VTGGLQVKPLASALWDSFHLEFWTSNRPVKAPAYASSIWTGV